MSIGRQIIPLFTFALAGAFPLISILAGNKTKQKISMVCAILGLCGCIAVEYALFQRSFFIGSIWIFYLLSLVVLFIAIKSGRKKWMLIICLLLALATIGFSIFLSFCRYYPGNNLIEAAGIEHYWMRQDWFEYLYNSWYVVNKTDLSALFVLPFSRGFLLLAIAFGIKLLPADKDESK